MRNQTDNNLSINTIEWINSIIEQGKIENSSYTSNMRKIGTNLLQNVNFPSKKDESWRFTKLDDLLQMKFTKPEHSFDFGMIEKYFFDKFEARCVLFNGILSVESLVKKKTSTQYFLGKFCDLDEQKKNKIRNFAGKGESGINGGFFPILNMASLDEVIVLYIPENVQIRDPIQIISATSTDGKQFCINNKFIILCERNSQAKIYQQHVGAENSEFFDNSTTNISIEDNAYVDFFLINQVPNTASCFNSIHADLKKDSSFNFLSVSFGGFLSRISLGIDLNGINAKCDVKGISVVADSQISDIHSRISHNYPSCNSTQLQKNLVSDKGHAIFAGKVQVHNGATETESNQLCKSLLLSSTAKIDSMPILEINNQDVKCTHGSTVSDLDEDQLFYFKSRGVPAQKARLLLTVGFVSEIIKKLPIELINYFMLSIK